MFTLGRLTLPSVLIPFLFAGTLFAQRYPERDHTVFHRTPPAQTKHQLSQGTSPRTHAATSTPASNGGHVGSTANSQGGSYSGSTVNPKSAVTAPEPTEHPQQ